MAGPYGLMCRDLIGGSLSIKARLVLDENAKLTVPNACVDYIEVSGNVVTSGISEHEGQQGIRIIGNLCMDENFTLKTDAVTERVPGEGVAIKGGVMYRQFGFGRAYLSQPQSFGNSNVATQIVLANKSFESSLTTSSGLIHPGNDTSKTFVGPTTATLPPPIGCSFGNVVVDTKLQLQANLFNAQSGDTITVLLANNGNVVAPLAQTIHTIQPATVTNEIQTFSLADIVKIAPGDQLDYYICAGNISGVLNGNLMSGQWKSFASFNVLSLEP
jgi:hypothetical protein